MMKADEIMTKYGEGERDFRGLNLNGLCFKGKNLSNANFSNSSIKSTNFSYANLQNCQFQNIKIGIGSNSLILLIIICCCLLILAGLGLFAVTISQLYLFSSTNFTAILLGVCFYIVNLFLFFILPFHLVKNNWLRLVAIPLITGLTGAIIGAFIGKITLPISLSLALIGGLTGVIIGWLIILIAMILILTTNILNFGTSFLVLLILLLTSLIMAKFFAFAQISTLISSLAIIIISFLLGWLALKNNLRYAFLLKFPESITRYLGTKFYHANLANAELDKTLMNMNNVDLRNANF